MQTPGFGVSESRLALVAALGKSALGVMEGERPS
jgi:hypothetical protein